MPDPAKLAGLVERVEKATGPDREIDARIEAALSSYAPEAVFEFFPARHTFHVRLDTATAIDEARDDYTASVDAALALVERVLPGQWARILRDALSAMARRYAWHMTLLTTEQLRELPIFVLAELLRALSNPEATG